MTLSNLSATALSEHFTTGKVSATEIVRETLARIEKQDPAIGAFLSVFNERALKKAAALDEKRKKGEKNRLRYKLPKYFQRGKLYVVVVMVYEK